MRWEGQTQGRTDAMIVNHEADGDELLLFYRTRVGEFPHGGFRYEGRYTYSSHVAGKPSKFEAFREGTSSSADVSSFDPSSIADGRQKTLAMVARRQGQGKFRRFVGRI